MGARLVVTSITIAGTNKLCNTRCQMNGYCIATNRIKIEAVRIATSKDIRSGYWKERYKKTKRLDNWNGKMKIINLRHFESRTSNSNREQLMTQTDAENRLHCSTIKNNLEVLDGLTTHDRVARSVAKEKSIILLHI